MGEVDFPQHGLLPAETRMELQYGVNEADSWSHFALGPQRERIWARHKELGTRIIRIFLFEKYSPDPVKDWQIIASCLDAVLQTGATPMVTFAKSSPPYDDLQLAQGFAIQCAEVVRKCIRS